MKKKIFINGSEGTTGLRINERFEGRDDFELLRIPSELRKDPATVKEYINNSDITFLCLPDAAAREAVAMVENDNTIIIDTSTAHRTEEGWAYGYPELSPAHREAIKNGKRIAVPGCHATGFITLVYPMVAGGILPSDYPVSAFSLTGYSGGGKKMIAEYEAPTCDETTELDADSSNELLRGAELDSPREYAMGQTHKHLKEMKAICGLDRLPLFSPIVADYYSGMLVSLPLYTDMLKNAPALKGNLTPEAIRDYFAEYYKGEPFIKVMPFGAEAETRGFLGSNNCTGWDGIQIFVTGNEDRIVLSSRFDNLGKGASGAAVQCLNAILGCEESKGLSL